MGSCKTCLAHGLTEYEILMTVDGEPEFGFEDALELLKQAHAEIVEHIRVHDP